MAHAKAPRVACFFVLLAACILPSARAARALAAEGVNGAGGGSSRARARDWGTPEEFMAAVNTGYEFKITTWESALAAVTPAPANGPAPAASHPMLKLDAVWWSARPRPFNMTVATQLSTNRLSRLYRLCRTWRGPLSAAAYVPLVQPASAPETLAGQLSEANRAALDKARREAEQFHARLEASPGFPCQLDLMLLYEVVDGEDAAKLYPFNIMRNYALMQVRTPLVSHIDADFMVSSTLSDEMEQPGSYKKYEAVCAQRGVTVLPAFEAPKPMLAPANITAAKRLLLRLASPAGRVSALGGVEKRRLLLEFVKGRVDQFDSAWKEGHGPTDYARWLTSPHTTPMYWIQYADGYEPWFITCYDTMLWYDPRFRGYGYDKMLMTKALNTTGYGFYVHPNAWIVHFPHPPSAGRVWQDEYYIQRNADQYVEQAQEWKLKNQGRTAMNAAGTLWITSVIRLYQDTSAAMVQQATYSVALDPRFTAAFSQLPWLQRPPPAVKHLRSLR